MIVGFLRNRCREKPMHPFSLHRVAAVLLSTTLCLCTGSALAADKSVKRDPTRADGDKLLTPAQIKACLGKKDSLRTQVDEALKDKTQIEADKAEIARTGATLGDELAALDRTNAEAVDAYNQKIVQRDKLIDAYQSRVTAYNTKAEGVKSTQDDYEKSCENRRYDERDLVDVQRKKK